MAPFETIWPREMHVPPKPVAWAAMLACGRAPLTSDIALEASLWRWKYAAQKGAA